MSSVLYEIGPFRLDPEAGVLTHAGLPMPLGARGVAVLATLVKAPNEYVRKTAILDAAWPDVVVEENSLAAQVSAIRRALAKAPGGEHWVETLPRRGYRFVGPVSELRDGLQRGATAGLTRSNLPEPMNAFVGRERELVELKRLLPTTRLLTLVGVGGIGKTRLALQLGSEVVDAYRDGVWLAEFASITDSALVPTSVAQALGVRETPGVPLQHTLGAHLKARRLLLILDNCEHVLDACATLVEGILRAAAEATIIATSREPLHVAAEQTYSLAPLSLPDPATSAEKMGNSEAVQLFVERARKQQPGFELIGTQTPAVAQLCIHLDGIPLALELAAARVRSLTIDEINARLDNRFRLLTGGTRTALPRQQTLRATLDWSYDLLRDAEKSMFARLSVFAGGWTLAAAEAVTATQGIAKDDVVDLLIALVEKSLVVVDNGGDRYRMLETVREYAKERLTRTGSAKAVQERHRDYFLALTEDAEPKLMGPEQGKWLLRLEEEHDNLRTALEWSLAEARSGRELRFCWALRHFWRMHAHLSEGDQWCTKALRKAGSEARTAERANALAAAGVVAFWLSDYPAARARHEESLAIRRELGDRLGISAALSDLGNVALRQGDLASARALYEESLAIKRQLGDWSGMAKTLNNLGNVAREQGDLASARALFEESLTFARELGDRGQIALLLGNLGFVACDQGDDAFARAQYDESLAIMRELGDRQGVARILTYLGRLAHSQEDFTAARALQEQGLTILREVGDRRMMIHALEGLAAADGALGSSLRAARIWGAAERLREDIGSPHSADERPGYELRVAAARAASGNDAAFNRAWQEGRAVTLEKAIALALGTVPS